jgi:hypothetical protein
MLHCFSNVEFGFRRIRLVGEGLYLFCLNRETKPGFGHSDQVSLAFRLAFGLYQELCRANSAICPGVHVSPRRQIEQLIQAARPQALGPQDPALLIALQN